MKNSKSFSMRLCEKILSPKSVKNIANIIGKRISQSVGDKIEDIIAKETSKIVPIDPHKDEKNMEKVIDAMNSEFGNDWKEDKVKRNVAIYSMRKRKVSSEKIAFFFSLTNKNMIDRCNSDMIKIMNGDMINESKYYLGIKLNRITNGKDNAKSWAEQVEKKLIHSKKIIQKAI